MGDRRKAREAALQILFQEDFNSEVKPFSSLKGVEIKEDDSGLTRQIVEGVFLHHAEIDRMICQNTEHWSSDRIAAVDMNVLRMAVFEILFLRETPIKVIINEAIEIAKKYGSEDSGAFVNGILDAVSLCSASVEASSDNKQEH